MGIRRKNRTTSNQCTDMKSLARRRHGHHTKATARNHSIRATWNDKPRAGTLRISMGSDLSTKERFARTFFSKCQFPILLEKNLKRELKLGKRYGILSGPTARISSNLLRIVSLGRFGTMTARFRAERLKSTIPLNQKRSSLFRS